MMALAPAQGVDHSDEYPGQLTWTVLPFCDQ